MFQFGELSYNGLACSALFDEGSRSEIEVISLDRDVLVRGSKEYVILDSSDGEKFQSRIGSIGTLTDYLRGSVAELELKAYWLNSLTPEVLELGCERPKSNLSDIQNERNRLELYKLYSDLALGDLESRYRSVKFNPEKVVEKNTLGQSIAQTVNLRRFADRSLEKLKDSLADAVEEDSDEARLVKAYLQHGFGACFLLTVRSEYYYVPKESLNKAIEYVLRDLKDQDVVIKQRAKQGFHLLIKELDLPSAILTRNTILNPKILGQLSKTYPELKPLFKKINEKFMYKLSRDVKLKNRKLERSLSLTQALSSLLRRAVSPEEGASLIPQPDFDRIPSANDVKNKKLIYLGLIARNGFRPSERPAFFDVDKLMTHALISGGTGSGKSVVAKILAENCLIHGIPVTVFDPTRQWVGFAKKCDDKEMLRKYKNFLLRPDDARSFEVRVFDNEKPSADDLQTNALNIVLTDKLEDKRKLDDFVYSITHEVFRYFTRREETTRLKALFITEEAYRLAPRRKGAPHRAIDELGQCVRELRKHGAGWVFLAQQISDFAAHLEGGLAIRGNPALRIQLKTNYEGDINRIRLKHGTKYADLIPKLPTGVGTIDFADYGRPYFVCFRPLLHYHKIFSEKEVQELLKQKVSRGSIEKTINSSAQQNEDFQSIPEFSDEEKSFLRCVLNFSDSPKISDIVSELRKQKWSVREVYRVKGSLEEKGVLGIINEKGKKLVKVALDGKALEKAGIS